MQLCLISSRHPPFLFLIGTFGAFIKIKSPIYRKDALLQIGAAGPIAGFIIAVPSLIIGLLLSDVIDKVDIQGAIMLGDSILMKLLTWLTHPGLLASQDIMLHPIAFAGWIGFISNHAEPFTNWTVRWRAHSLCDVGRKTGMAR